MTQPVTGRDAAARWCARLIRGRKAVSPALRARARRDRRALIRGTSSPRSGRSTSTAAAPCAATRRRDAPTRPCPNRLRTRQQSCPPPRCATAPEPRTAHLGRGDPLGRALAGPGTACPAKTRPGAAPTLRAPCCRADCRGVVPARAGRQGADAAAIRGGRSRTTARGADRRTPGGVGSTEPAVGGRSPREWLLQRSGLPRETEVIAALEMGPLQFAGLRTATREISAPPIAAHESADQRTAAQKIAAQKIAAQGAGRHPAQARDGRRPHQRPFGYCRPSGWRPPHPNGRFARKVSRALRQTDRANGRLRHAGHRADEADPTTPRVPTPSRPEPRLGPSHGSPLLPPPPPARCSAYGR